MADELKPSETDSVARGFRAKLPGPLAWMANNHVAANVLMLVLIVGGLINTCRVKQEVFPEVDLDLILINVPYPGASPEEVETGVILAVEEAVRGIDGIKELRSTASENVGVVAVELMLGTDPDRALSDVKAAVDRIASFPEDVERPVVFMASNRFEVLSLAVYGDHSEKVLREVAEQVRDALLRDERITYVELLGVRPLEVAIEVPQSRLVEHGMTLDEIAGAVRQSSVEVPGGAVKTAGGEVLLRTDERRDRGGEFSSIALLSRPDGTSVTVGDVAEVVDGYAETDLMARFEGKRAVMVKVFRGGDQTPLDVSAAVYEHIEAFEGRLPPGVALGTWFDMSEFYQGRIDLLKKNAIIGVILVFIVLGLFLEIRLAFWVTLGIPISFLGAFLFLPAMDVSINMISLFAFILVLGMVVDDAIIVGEAVYKHRQEGKGRLQSAVDGAREVAVPVCFAIVTTIVAFMPLLFVPGVFGKFFRVIPLTVISVLILSLVESLLILPSHLSHGREKPRVGSLFGAINRVQQRFSRFLERVIQVTYVPTVRAAVRNRYLTAAIALGVLLFSLGWAGGRMQFSPMPKVDSDVVAAMVSMPYGTSIELTRAVQEKMLRTAREVLEDSGGEANIKRGLLSMVGAMGMTVRDPRGGGLNEGSHLTEVAVYLHEDRPITASAFAQQWREKLADTPGVEKMSFFFSTGPGAGAAIQVELSHRDRTVLEQAAGELAVSIGEFDGISDLDDGFAEGKQQLNLKLTDEAQSLGLSQLALARQVRAAFFGAEAGRQQRGRDELRIYVRLPRDERESEYNVEELLVRTPMGGWMPFEQAARVVRGRAYTSISRVDGRRAVTVTADIDATRANAGEVLKALSKQALPDLLAKYPGLSYEIGGAEKDFDEANKSLASGGLFALIVMVGLLAVVFRSYSQWIVVMVAIPFGFVGAVWGHVAMGFDFSLLSMMGVVALAGVVVNDSLLLVVTVNRYREDGMPIVRAVVEAGERRFRPILLTSLTTFFGLAPMILETSVQARFLIPMALSLGFGVMFATFITLLLVPATYLILDDVVSLVRRGWNYVYPPPA